MIETLELHLKSEANRFLKPSEGAPFLGLRIVKFDADDPRLPAIARAEQEAYAKSGIGVVLGWKIRRRYTNKEIDGANLFRLIRRNGFRPTGQECGTMYDLATMCPVCGAGRIQRSELVLDLRKLPKRLGIAVSLSGEMVVSQQTAELMIDENLTGFELKQVRHRSSPFTGPLKLETVPAGREILLEAERAGIAPHSGAFYVWLNRNDPMKLLLDRAMSEAGARSDKRSAGKPLPVWYQLLPEGNSLEVCDPTRFGINPVNDDVTNQFRCSRGHTAGLDVLSEISVQRSSWDGRDFCATKQLAGYHPPESLLYPQPLLMISPKFRSFLERHNLKGFRTEVAHVK